LQIPDDSLHRKFDRCLIANPVRLEGETKKYYEYRCSLASRARSFLCILTKCYLMGEPLPKKKEKENWDPIVEKHNFFQQIQLLCSGDVQEFLTLFVQKEVEGEIFQKIGALLDLCVSNNDALSVIFPFLHHQEIIACCDCVLQGGDTANLLQKMNFYNAELASLLQCCISDNRLDITQKVASFVRTMVQQVTDVHDQDRPAPPPAPHEGSYNPPKGAAYYFTEHGGQVRDLPKYSISGKDKKGGCVKNFPQVSAKGFGYMFLMFCPYHRHCYGFHLIDGGEGCKDPFAAMFAYMEEPPEEFFYDFACKLSEYSLNREPHFFRCVRFWHDLFHGINHICGDCFKSQRVLGLSDTDTEVCEQFNSYLQCIKYTASHFGQANFMLFTQFFIYLYNRRCTESYKGIAQTALAGLRP